ncbi:MAG: type II secretion system secretin GspD [Pseudomonadales bacterium]|nr:type II secretion system secretin GspD [Pseudomonadales bacterium]
MTNSTPPISIKSFRQLVLCIIVLLAGAGSFRAFGQENTWQLNIKNADISEFTNQVAAMTGKTFIISPKVKGKVTVISNSRMNKEGIYQLFLSVLRVHGFTTIESGDIVKIEQLTLAKQSPSVTGEAFGEQLITRVIAVNNLNSQELVKILRPLIPQQGSIGFLTNPNVLIIGDHVDNINRLIKIIRQIDVADEDEIVVVPLKDAWVGTIVSLLEKLAPQQLAQGAKGPQRITVIANERNNSLILRGKSKPVGVMLKLVNKLDKPATASGTTQVYYLGHADAEETASIVNALISSNKKGSGDSSTQQATSIQADVSLNALVVRAEPSVMRDVSETVKLLDVSRTQVLIEAAIVEISLDNSDSLGVTIAGVDSSGSSVPLFNTALTGALGTLLKDLIPTDPTAPPGNAPIAATAGLTTPTIAVAKVDPDGISFSAIVQALSSATQANLLSTPHITTVDNKEAKISVGQEVPIRTGEFTSGNNGSTNPFTTIQRKDVGLELIVTPHVYDGSRVRLEISQEVSSVVPSVSIGDGGFSDIVTNKRTLDTTVIADDGQTIVLGGLIQDDTTHIDSKVPLLGDIPVLGRLFRSTSSQKIKKSLLVFLRPTVLRSDKDVKAVTDRKYADIWEISIESEDTESPSIAPPAIEELYKGLNRARGN